MKTISLGTTGDRTRVLFVDDEPSVLEGLRRAVYTEFVADLALGPDEGIAKLRSHGPYPIVVSDMRMPGMDGAQFLAASRNISPASIRVMLTGLDDMEAAGRAVNEGQIFRFLTKPVTREKLVDTLRQCNAQYRVACIEKDYLKATIEELEELDLGALTSLARAIDAKSAWTAGHSERVTSLALKIAHAMGLNTKSLHIIHRGALLHDIGKIGTPATVLEKPGTLDAEEVQIMRDHVKIGLRILEPIPCFRDALPMVAQHHEWFDGSGYPAGLAGENIDLHARILAVADCYDAMVSDRPYRRGLTTMQAIQTLKQRSGKQFDPLVIQIVMRLADAGHLA
jgi:putative nucleotidyltransferase with HDIG domain